MDCNCNVESETWEASAYTCDPLQDQICPGEKVTILRAFHEKSQISEISILGKSVLPLGLRSGFIIPPNI